MTSERAEGASCLGQRAERHLTLGGSDLDVADTVEDRAHRLAYLHPERVLGEEILR